MYTKKEREQYNIDRDRTCQRLGITINEYNWFRRKGAELHKLYENQCNGVYDNSLPDETIATFEVRERAKKLGMYIYLQTDPRGATVYLDKVAIPDNNYTQACCIY